MVKLAACVTYWNLCKAWDSSEPRPESFDVAKLQTSVRGL